MMWPHSLNRQPRHRGVYEPPGPRRTPNGYISLRLPTSGLKLYTTRLLSTHLHPVFTTIGSTCFSLRSLPFTMVDLNKPGSVERCIALAEINAIVNRYCILARENAPWAEMAKLFEPSGVFRLSNGTELSPEAMSGVIGGMEPNFIRHHITSTDIKFTSSSEAHVESFFLAVTDQAPLDHWGGWIDTFIRQGDGSWLIRDRTILLNGNDKNGWSAARRGYKNSTC